MTPVGSSCCLPRAPLARRGRARRDAPRADRRAMAAGSGAALRHPKWRRCRSPRSVPLSERIAAAAPVVVDRIRWQVGSSGNPSARSRPDREPRRSAVGGSATARHDPTQQAGPLSGGCHRLSAWRSEPHQLVNYCLHVKDERRAKAAAGRSTVGIGAFEARVSLPVSGVMWSAIWRVRHVKLGVCAARRRRCMSRASSTSTTSSNTGRGAMCVLLDASWTCQPRESLAPRRISSRCST
jgi:hypothetical protein